MFLNVRIVRLKLYFSLCFFFFLFCCLFFESDVSNIRRTTKWKFYEVFYEEFNAGGSLLRYRALAQLDFPLKITRPMVRKKPLIHQDNYKLSPHSPWVISIDVDYKGAEGAVDNTQASLFKLGFSQSLTLKILTRYALNSSSSLLSAW